MKTIATVCLATAMMLGVAFGQSSTGQTPKDPPKQPINKEKKGKKKVKKADAPLPKQQ